MKTKLLFFGIGIVSLITFFSSCSKDKTTTPESASLTFDPDTTYFEGLPGDTWSFTITAKAPSGLDSLYIEKTVGTGTPTLYASVKNVADNTITYNFSYTLVEEEVNVPVTLTFTLAETGTNGKSATKIVITDSQPARRYTTKLYLFYVDKYVSSFFSTNTGESYLSDKVFSSVDSLSSDIDFGYFNDITNQASLASPKGFTSTVFASQVDGWITLNDITFKSTKITESLFMLMSTFANIDDAYDAGTTPDTPDIITKLAPGQVVAFKTDSTKTGGSKKGLILISDIQGTFIQYNTNYMKLDILIQEPAE
jgi:hypothetical protein